MKTWKLEMLVVAMALTVALTWAGPSGVEVLGALAVLCGFGHAQVAERMREREALKTKPDVSCHRWAMGYFLAKEALWLVYFVLHQSWSALVGVVVFLLYPLWRKWWRARHPLRPAWLGDVRFARVYLNGREFQVRPGVRINVDAPWSAALTLDLLRVADWRDIDHMTKLGNQVHVFFVIPGGLRLAGKAAIARLRFWEQPDLLGLPLASLDLIGSGGLEHV